MPSSFCSLRSLSFFFALIIIYFSGFGVASKNSKIKRTKTKDACAAPTPISTGVPNPPVKYGMVLYQAFEIFDVYGPLQVLNMLSRSWGHLDLSLISYANDTSVITTEPVNPAMNPYNSTIYPTLPPTHSMANPPMDLDVLILPGGLGTRSPYLQPTVDYITAIYPNLQYIISVCTGASLLAKAGILDGKIATTNKASWDSVVRHGPNTTWVEQARWVVDGNIWTSSGVSASIDATVAFIDSIYGHAVAVNVTNLMEWNVQSDATYDPFAQLYGLGA